MGLSLYEVTHTRFVNGTCQNARKIRKSMRLGLTANSFMEQVTLHIPCTFSSRRTITIIPRCISLTALFSTITRFSHGDFINIYVVANQTCLPSH